MDKEQLELLEEFVDLCRIRPSVLESKELKFFRDWLLELGAKLPTENTKKHESHPSFEAQEPMEEDDESAESDIEISNDGVIEGDEVVTDQFMGDQTIEVTEEMQDAADEKRNDALSQFREGNYEEAIKLFTEAIKLNPTCAMVYAKRASCYVKMRCPNAAIKDCNRCFEFNPDSALAYKWRGISLKLLGKWEESFSDLTQSLKLDYADDTYENMKEVETKAKLIREHKRKYERKREDKLLNAKRERIRRAQEANEKAKKQQHHQQHDFGDMPGSGCCGGAGGCKVPPEDIGGMSAGIGDLLNDPELVEDLKDPDVMAALSEIMANPASLLKHQSNPKISKIMSRMQNKFGGGVGPMETDDFTEAAAAPPPQQHVPKSSNIAEDLD